MVGSATGYYVTDCYGNEGILVVVGGGGGLILNGGGHGFNGFYASGMDKIWELEGFGASLGVDLDKFGISVSAARGPDSIQKGGSGNPFGEPSVSFTAEITYSYLIILNEVVR